jgi:hypothetical protein
MTLDQFCTKLASLELPQSKQALAILWFHDEKVPDVVMNAGEFARIIHRTGLGSPHSTKLGESIKKTGMVVTSSAGFKLKTLARSQIREWLLPILGGPKPEIDQDLGYLSREVWKDTRGYVENVCEQMNGCYQYGFYDAASVMMRRVVETLLIEAYEALGRADEIKDGNGNYFMLRDLVARAIGNAPIGLGRDARDALGRIKEMGDRSAHNRRFNAVKSDMDKVQSGVRVVVDELINLASLRRRAPQTGVSLAAAP